MAELINSTSFFTFATRFKNEVYHINLGRKQDTLFECLKDAFEYTEGVPKEIWFDNMRTVVDRPRTQYKKVVFNNLFYQFSKDANFEPIACRPYRPQTKGCLIIS
ncbi:hypothetical protein ACVPOY_12980 [Staphylococcus aureus]